MSYSQAITKAHKRAKQSDAIYYVIVDCGSYCIADDEAMDTFFAGLEPVYCTADN